MRLCRFRHQGQSSVGFYDESGIVPLSDAAAAFQSTTGRALDVVTGDDLLEFLPSGGRSAEIARQLHQFITTGSHSAALRLPLSSVELLVPVPRPAKLFLLAGNYAAHIEEAGEKASEREETFPYVFMKPPTTTLTDPGKPIRIPTVSPAHVDWELELAVVIGRVAKGVTEADALKYVAGYTIINDISDRKFRPNPGRKPRDRDAFFDWLHGKWHDGFCPMGPCIASADAIPDPQKLSMQLRVNGKTFQDSTTAAQVFPVAAVIEFISSFVTLEPGDIISTGTPSGVGSTTGTFLRPGDRVDAFIEAIGTLSSPVE